MIKHKNLTEAEYKKHAQRNIEELEIKRDEELAKVSTVMEKAAVRDSYRSKIKYWTAKYASYETAQVSCEGEDECLMCGS
jgi:hypothetical protein